MPQQRHQLSTVEGLPRPGVGSLEADPAIEIQCQLFICEAIPGSSRRGARNRGRKGWGVNRESDAKFTDVGNCGLGVSLGGSVEHELRVVPERGDGALVVILQLNQWWRAAPGGGRVILSTPGLWSAVERTFCQ